VQHATARPAKKSAEGTLTANSVGALFEENTMSNITKVIASVTKIHGGEREQVAKQADYLRWLAARKPSSK
jgi:hypothetical protein